MSNENWLTISADAALIIIFCSAIILVLLVGFRPVGIDWRVRAYYQAAIIFAAVRIYSVNAAPPQPPWWGSIIWCNWALASFVLMMAIVLNIIRAERRASRTAS
jgi:hypothetical protein